MPFDNAFRFLTTENGTFCRVLCWGSNLEPQFGASGSSISEELRNGGLTIPLVGVQTMDEAVVAARGHALAGECWGG